MREVHHELAALQGTVNPLSALGKQFSERFSLICFDEFHVADITDAMILHRLLDALFEYGVGFVTTSNFKPNDLYPDGLHRDRIFPAIELLNDKLEVLNVDHGVDYRRQTLEQADLYLCPNGEHANEVMLRTFQKLSGPALDSPQLNIESRQITALRRAADVVWFDFKTLCGGPRSQNDYLELASRFQTIFLSDVPQMSALMASEARRFTWLVDVMYDRRVKLIISAEVQPEELYRPPVYSEMKATTESLGLDKPDVKPILKMVKPIRPNTRPVAIPTMALRRLPPIFRKAVTKHMRHNKRKGSAKLHTRRRRR
jgi:cell division protein ZapE